MSNITYLKGKMGLYYHCTTPPSILHNNYWLQCKNYHLLELYQYMDFLTIPTWEGLYMHKTCVIIYLVCNYHFWHSTRIINLCQTFYLFIWGNWSYHYLNIINIFIKIIIRTNIIIFAQCNFHTFGLPFNFIVLAWDIRLILFSRIILVGHLAPLK